MQDERNQILTAYLWIRQIWHDAYLTWDREQYDGLDSIRIPSELVWRPDIILYNKWVPLRAEVLGGPADFTEFKYKEKCVKCT